MKYQFLTLVLIALSFFSCEDDKEETSPEQFIFEPFGLQGNIINDIMRQENKLFALTDNGLYENSSTSNGNWKNLNLDDKEVIGFKILQNGDYFAVWNNPQDQSPVSGISISSNQGDSWEEIDHNFGGKQAEQFSSFYALDSNPNVMYAGGWGVLAKSTDGGKSWVPQWGDWGMLANGVDEIALNPSDTIDIWFGGQGSIENGYLVKKTGNTTKEWDDLVPNPTVVKNITFDPTDPNNVYVGFEGALLKTDSGGNSWQTLIESTDNRFFFGIEIPSKNNQTIYTGGWLKSFNDPQPLILFTSEDGGTTWEEIKHEVEDFGGINSMLLVEGDSQDLLFLGLYKGGVYRVTINK